ncbi:helix-turn-helix domain-containing protein, partial [Streptomyces sp. NPDC006332]|uniref:helix-turn-helix domain-containing protein n=1 Tax=Streptomyces sp. NPDC006332 TaxID=3155456 RepID=UPI00339F8759
MDQGVGAGRGAVLPRALVVRRLLERQQAARLSTRHVRVVAETVGVSERTVWRWLERTKAKATGRAEAPVRRGTRCRTRCGNSWAKALVEQSGTAGQEVGVVVQDDDVNKSIGQYLQSLLTQLGYKAKLKPL